MDVIKDHFAFLCSKKALTGELIDKHRDLFAKYNIFHNESGVDAYILAEGTGEIYAKGKSTVFAEGKSKVSSYGETQVIAKDNTRIKAFRNSKVMAGGNSKVEGYDYSHIYAPRTVKVNLHDDAVRNMVDDNVNESKNGAEDLTSRKKEISSNIKELESMEKRMEELEDLMWGDDYTKEDEEEAMREWEGEYDEISDKFDKLARSTEKAIRKFTKDADSNFKIPRGSELSDLISIFKKVKL